MTNSSPRPAAAQRTASSRLGAALLASMLLAGAAITLGACNPPPAPARTSPPPATP